MQLTTPTETPLVQVAATAPTVVQPGEEVVVTIAVEARQPVELLALQWEAPEVVRLVPDQRLDLPVSLRAGERFEARQVFLTDPQQEGFGEMHATLALRGEGETARTAASWTAWISVFEPMKAPDDEPLNDRGRRRLIEVVNARARNGHIFLADSVAFFDDFLHILISERLAAVLAREFGFADEGLPLDRAAYLHVILGLLSFYGIEKLELIAEEECEESDDRFDPDEAREVAYEINL